MEIEVKRKAKVKVPRVPNFIDVDGVYRSIAEFTDVELRSIGASWVTNLVDLARKRRKK